MRRFQKFIRLKVLCSACAFLAAALLHGACQDNPENKIPEPRAVPTAADAEKFIADAENLLTELAFKSTRAFWVQANFITEDTELIADWAAREQAETDARLAEEIKKFDGVPLPPEIARKFQLLRLSLFSLSDPAERAEIAALSAGLEQDYGEGKACLDEGGYREKYKGKCLEIGEVERIFAGSRDADELKAVWKASHDGIGAPLRDRYARYVQLQNKGARELGFSDMGAMWRSGYDMPPEEFSAEAERLWKQVKPLYESLHAYMRTRLIGRYGRQAMTEEGLIRADLLGSVRAQDWGAVYPLAAPSNAGRGYDLTAILKQKKIDERGMVGYGENFFKSLGFDPLPRSFWERSLFVRPRDREVVCHASAWDMDGGDDLRLKMCVGISAEDFITIHHELGHNFYQRAYRNQPFLFQDGANDGFHEAIGDTIALSITTEYLKQVGLLPSGYSENAGSDVDFLLRKAMDKIASLPFGLMIDQWRWKIMAESIPDDRYNVAWWELREKYQGIAPPVIRTENDFDPGTNYYIATNVPYMRYFLANILQFQFYRALSREAGCDGPLHRCSFYDDKRAGARLNTMLEMGRSRPWPEALMAITGESVMDAAAFMEYFEPLKKWLDAENVAAGTIPGWVIPKNPLSPSFIRPR